jgi:cellulose biosynthesis protein BcsQ
MPVIAIVNRKGGSGKSTLATHLAACYANSGVAVMLGDVDRQQSTQSWLRLRSEQAPPTSAPIVGWAVDPKRVLRPPAGVSLVILDTPGGLHGFDLARVVAFADIILMPVCNSAFDRESGAACHAELIALPRVASSRCKVAAVGMRLDARTRAAETLAAWAAGMKRLVAALREAQVYVRGIERGLTLFDQPAEKGGGSRAMEAAGRLAEPILPSTIDRRSAAIRRGPAAVAGHLDRRVGAEASSCAGRGARAFGRASSRGLVRLADRRPVSSTSLLEFSQGGAPGGLAAHPSAAARRDPNVLDVKEVTARPFVGEFVTSTRLPRAHGWLDRVSQPKLSSSFFGKTHVQSNSSRALALTAALAAAPAHALTTTGVACDGHGTT